MVRPSPPRQFPYISTEDADVCLSQSDVYCILFYLSNIRIGLCSVFLLHAKRVMVYQHSREYISVWI